MDRQSVDFVVWLGIVVLAIIWANVSLRRERRRLDVRQQSAEVSESRSVSTSVAHMTTSERAA